MGRSVSVTCDGIRRRLLLLRSCGRERQLQYGSSPRDTQVDYAAWLPAEGHQAIVVALLADDAPEPVRQDPALEECLDLLEHETRQLGLGAAAHLGEERELVRLDCLVEERVLWAVALVLRDGARCDRAVCQGAAIGHLDSSEVRRFKVRPHPWDRCRASRPWLPLMAVSDRDGPLVGTRRAAGRLRPGHPRRHASRQRPSPKRENLPRGGSSSRSSRPRPSISRNRS